jgi:hypothetical protein
MIVDLTDDEREALLNLITVEIQSSHYPLSPRITRLKRIRAKLTGEAVSAAPTGPNEPPPPARPPKSRRR